MRDLHYYVKNYGKYTFLEKEFNEVDNVILALLSYIDFSNIVPGLDNGSIKLKDACSQFYKKHKDSDIKKYILAVRESCYLLKELAESNRFKDLVLSDYVYEVTFDMQFGALCITLPNKVKYISYEGTDNYVSGWKEDFVMSYKFPTNAQVEAVKYINKVVKLFGPKVYVGGHSKGGNLALIAGMYCRHYVFRKIISVYNNDGPGVKLEEFRSRNHKRVSKKLVQIVPKESFVGMLLYKQGTFTVVDSNKRYFFQHDAVNWGVEDDHFIKTDISSFSKKIEHAVLSWLDKYDFKEREEFVNALFSILKKAEVDDLEKLKEAKISSMLKILKEMKNISKEHRAVLTKGLMLMYNEWKDE